jgi:hypothetical protein
VAGRCHRRAERGREGAPPWDPQWEPITRPVFVWLEIVAQLAVHLTADEQLRVNAVLQDWLGEHDPD